MRQSRYRAGIIGLGFIGGADQVSGDALGQRVDDLDGTHFSALMAHPRVELVAGSSRDAGRRERFQQRSGARTYADWRQLLKDENLDIVSVATYAPQHAEIALACAERGVAAVYCEKPIATTLRDAERMVAECRRSGTLLAINHNRRFHPLYRQLRESIAAGNLGSLTSGSLQWGTGRLGNVGTHMFDTLRMLTGQEVAAVSGTLDQTGRPDCRGAAFRDPGGWGLLRMQSGLTITVDAADEGRVPARITLNGTFGRATTGANDVALEFWDGRNKNWHGPGRESSSMDRAVEEIVSSLDGDRPFPWPADDAVRALEVIVALHASHRRNAAWVKLPLHAADREIAVHSG